MLVELPPSLCPRWMLKEGHNKAEKPSLSSYQNIYKIALFQIMNYILTINIFKVQTLINIEICNA